MAQGYYTLEEAANLLSMAVDELKMKARKGDVRSFQDRGTWRFRVQDIQEMARQRGLGSEPDLVLGDSLNPVPKKNTSGLKKPTGVRKSILKPGDNPAAAPVPPASEPDAFDFELPMDEDTVGIGYEPLQTGPGTSKKSGPKSKLGNTKSKLAGPKSSAPAPKSSAAKSSPGPVSPPPPKKTAGFFGQHVPGSDSDVRLVDDDPNVDFGIEVDSDVRLAASPPPKQKSSGKLPGQKSSGKLHSSRPSKLAPGQSTPPQRRRSEVKASPPDSGVRLVPMDSDSDVRIVAPDQSGDEISLGATPPKSALDSDIRLEFDLPGEGAAEPGSLTEEIDLDAEMHKHQSQLKAAPPPAAAPAFPAESPFELSDTDFNLPATGSSIAQAKDSPTESGSDNFDLSPAVSDSSDFELTPAGASSSPVEGGGDDFELPMPDDNDDLGLSGSDAVGKAVDSGISLEQESEGSDELDFTLNIDEHHPKTPSPSEYAHDSSSEFELTLGAEDSSGEMSALEESSEFDLAVDVPAGAAEAPAVSGESSEFELTLDADGSSSEFELTIDATGESAAAPDLASDSEFELQLEDTGLESSSEFELTIDDDMQLVTDEDATPQVELEEEAGLTDLDDSPMAGEETDSGLVSLDEDDTGLEDSDFEIEVDEGDSSSQVVALEEEDLSFEEVEAGEKGAEVEQDFGEIGYEEGGYEEAAERGSVERETVIVERDVYAAPWSAWPVIVMLPCVVVMFFIGLMGFELIQSLNGYQEPGYITKAIGQMIGIDKM